MSLFRSVVNPKTLVLGGLAVAAVAGALKNRDRVAGLIGARSSEPEPPRPEPGFTPTHEATPAPGQPAAAPAPSNYDLSGPAENTATTLPAPDPVVRAEGAIDEAAEEAAAAAEAAAIGGPTPDYAGRELGESADDPFRPLAESGEGEAEGLEQAEADLADNIEPHAGETSDAERRIEETIELQGNPARGEIVEPLPGQRDGGRAEAEQAAVGAEEPRSPATGTPTKLHSRPGAGETAERAAGAAPSLPDTGGAQAARQAADDERAGTASVAQAADPGPGSGLPDPAGPEAAGGGDFAGGKTGGDEPTGGAFGETGDAGERGHGGSATEGSTGSALGETGAPDARAEDDADDAEWQTWSGNAGRS